MVTAGAARAAPKSNKLKYRLILRKMYSSHSEISRFRFLASLTMRFLVHDRCSIQHALKKEILPAAKLRGTKRAVEK